jgi:hypothetical protein
MRDRKGRIFFYSLEIQANFVAETTLKKLAAGDHKVNLFLLILNK